jgi:hypothetical protein
MKGNYEDVIIAAKRDGFTMFKLWENQNTWFPLDEFTYEYRCAIYEYISPNPWIERVKEECLDQNCKYHKPYRYELR